MFCEKVFYAEKKISCKLSSREKILDAYTIKGFKKTYHTCHPGLRAACVNRAAETIGNPASRSLCVTRDITRVNYREHMRQSLGLKICLKIEIKIDENYHVASFCSP